jgi:hypothetical protein
MYDAGRLILGFSCQAWLACAYRNMLGASGRVVLGDRRMVGA